MKVMVYTSTHHKGALITGYDHGQYDLNGANQVVAHVLLCKDNLLYDHRKGEIFQPGNESFVNRRDALRFLNQYYKVYKIKDFKRTDQEVVEIFKLNTLKAS